MVIELTAGDKRAVVWEISGSHYGSHYTGVVTYGQAPGGFDVGVPAAALTRRSNYEVIAVATDRSGGGTAVTRFTVQADGTVVATSTSAAAPRVPEKDFDWLAQHRQKALDALMPLDDPVAQVSYRSYRDLYHEVPERYFSIRFDPASAGEADRDNLQATVVAPIGRSIQAQLLDLHMKGRGASFKSVLARVSISRATLSAKKCQVVRDRMDALSRVRLQAPEWNVIHLHPFLHRIVINGSAGRIDATLEDDKDPLVVWGTETHEALMACALGYDTGDAIGSSQSQRRSPRPR